MIATLFQQLDGCRRLSGEGVPRFAFWPTVRTSCDQDVDCICHILVVFGVAVGIDAEVCLGLQVDACWQMRSKVEDAVPMGQAAVRHGVLACFEFWLMKLFRGSECGHILEGVCICTRMLSLVSRAILCARDSCGGAMFLVVAALANAPFLIGPS